MKKVAITLLTTLVSLATYAQTKTWTIDQSHSKVNFSVSHLVISEVDGTFKKFDGKIISKSNDFSNAKISFKIDVNSINTDNEQRDGHLKSEDFFYTEKYPRLTFKSTALKKIKGDNYLLKGNLTLRGVSKQIELNVKHGGIAIDSYGNTRAGFIITGSLDRTTYGVAWNAKTKEGTWTVGEEVKLLIKLELIASK